MKKFLKFEACWCNQCKQMDKVLSKTDLPIEHIDVDEEENETLVEKYNIRSMPTLVLVNEDGTELTRFNGITPIDKLKEAYETN